MWHLEKLLIRLVNLTGACCGDVSRKSPNPHDRLPKDSLVLLEGNGYLTIVPCHGVIVSVSASSLTSAERFKSVSVVDLNIRGSSTVVDVTL